MPWISWPRQLDPITTTTITLLNISHHEHHCHSPSPLLRPKAFIVSSDKTPPILWLPCPPFEVTDSLHILSRPPEGHAHKCFQQLEQNGHLCPQADSLSDDFLLPDWAQHHGPPLIRGLLFLRRRVGGGDTLWGSATSRRTNETQRSQYRICCHPNLGEGEENHKPNGFLMKTRSRCLFYFSLLLLLLNCLFLLCFLAVAPGCWSPCGGLNC